MLEGLKATVEEHGLHSLRPLIEYELALVAKQQRKAKEARAHLEAVHDLLADEPYAFVRHKAANALAEL